MNVRKRKSPRIYRILYIHSLYQDFLNSPLSFIFGTVCIFSRRFLACSLRSAMHLLSIPFCKPSVEKRYDFFSLIGEMSRIWQHQCGLKRTKSNRIAPNWNWNTLPSMHKIPHFSPDLKGMMPFHFLNWHKNLKTNSMAFAFLIVSEWNDDEVNSSDNHRSFH